ncbi:YihY/virulence factor BrkB family protein [Tessaracoccus flavus]|uniref:Ribonuclease BN n=1 Tax=Tessaracoccus flavus TaxID=1610493 RepID=A0A1Q2CCQ1_9ACTN|nr:YihY/virulence factor BrkB family protein [Tessaracoccus flavus]AQP43860.1 ribonuclease BN [Tessaracoccus flavus]SDY26542.1 membrane protein [Tessaracoccus flavus]
MSTTSTPHPEHSSKPDSPTDIKPPSWKFVFKNAAREFGDDGLSDAAAGLTYYTVLSLFPAIIALVSILSLFGQSGDLLRNLITDLQDRGAIPVDALDVIMPVMESLLETPAPGIGLILGLLVAMWTASNYVKAFSRAMNRIYEIPEGRGFVKFNASMYALTAGMLALLALVLVLITVSGPLAESIGSLIGLGETALTVFNYAKWPILLVIVILIVSILYWGTPNVKQPKFRWLTIGAGIAIIGTILASLAFAFYVSNFGSYDETYGTLAGVIIFLFWVNIINSVLLFGAEIDAELERGRQLQGGIAAEKEIQLPMRDDKAAIKKQKKAREAVAEARELRLTAGASSDPDEKDESKS